MESPQPPSFADLLKLYRTGACLTQEELAERANLSARSISDLERGIKQRPHRSTVDLIVAALDLTSEEREELEESIQRRRGAYRIVGSASRNTPPTTVPVPPTPLVGRERDLAEAVHRLRWGGVRMLTIIGPGGVGKTRLGIAMAHALEGDAQDGVFYVPLAPLRDADLIALTLLRALELRQTSGRPADEILISALRKRDMMLVLDNFEHLLSATDLLSRMLHECPRLRLVVTSRTALKIQGEQRFELAPLDLPGPEQLANLDTLAGYPAVELFVERARAIKRSFELSEANLRTVVEICSRLDGLPLAIELAAARINTLTPQALLMRLDQRLRVLTDGVKDLPDRQRTMSDAIAWSYHLLDAPAQRLFRRLSIFAGGWSLDAAEWVDRHQGAVLLRDLDALVDSSMIQGRETADGEPRYSMLETVREYGAAQLEAEGALDEVREAHASYFHELAERALVELTRPEADIWLTRLKHEEGNLRAALRWLADTERIQEGLSLAGALWRFWYTRGSFSEGRSWLSRFLEPAGAGQVEPALRARACFGLGAMAYSQSDFDTARAQYDESLALWRGLGDDAGVAAALNGLGTVAISTGDYARAERLLSECVELRRRDRDRFGLAAALNNLANAARYQGDLQRAAALYDESLEIHAEGTAPLGAAATLNNLAQLMLLRGNYQRARELSEQALALAREFDMKFGAAQALGDLGSLAIELGDLKSAEERYDQALEIYREIGDKSGTGLVLVNQANLARARHEYGRARTLALESLQIQREVRDERHIAYGLRYLGDIAREQGEYAEAAEHYREGLRLAARIHFLVGVAECLEHNGWLLAAQRGGQGPALLGAAHSLRESLGMVLTPMERPQHDRALTDLRNTLNEDSFRRNWERGRAMGWQDAVTEILERPHQPGQDAAPAT